MAGRNLLGNCSSTVEQVPDIRIRIDSSRRYPEIEQQRVQYIAREIDTQTPPITWESNGEVAVGGAVARKLQNSRRRTVIDGTVLPFLADLQLRTAMDSPS